MTREYEDRLHGNLWNLMAQGRFQWFRIDPSRKDRDDFVAAIKTFVDIWGCAEFRDDTYSSFRVFERPDRVKEEIDRIRKYKPMESVKQPKVYIDTKKELSLLTGDETRLKSKPIPGVCSSPDIVEKIMNERKNKTNEKKRKSK